MPSTSPPSELTEPGDRRSRCWCSARRSGTSVDRAVGACAAAPRRRFHVVGWDLPGHGRSRAGPTSRSPWPSSPPGVLALVDGVLDAARPVPRRLRLRRRLGRRRASGCSCCSTHPDRVAAAVLLCTGARIGEPDRWRERAAQVSAAGTSVMVAGLGASAGSRRASSTAIPDDGDRGCCTPSRTPTTRATRRSARRWPTSTSGTGWARSPRRCSPSPVRATWPPRPRCSRRSPPASRTAGWSCSTASPTSPPAEAPDAVAELIAEHLPGGAADRRRTGPPRAREVYDAGMAVRREVLGDAHVDRATAAADDFTARVPGAHHPLRLGRRSGPGPAWTVAAAP